jgi:hypothetical protein
VELHPDDPGARAAWSEAVASRWADADPRLIEARQEAEHVQHETSRLTAWQMDERQQLRRAIYRDPYGRDSAERRATDAAQRAERDRRLLV